MLKYTRFKNKHLIECSAKLFDFVLHFIVKYVSKYAFMFVMIVLNQSDPVSRYGLCPCISEVKQKKSSRLISY